MKGRHSIPLIRPHVQSLEWGLQPREEGGVFQLSVGIEPLSQGLALSLRVIPNSSGFWHSQPCLSTCARLEMSSLLWHEELLARKPLCSTETVRGHRLEHRKTSGLCCQAGWERSRAEAHPKGNMHHKQGVPKGLVSQLGIYFSGRSLPSQGLGENQLWY